MNSRFRTISLSAFVVGSLALACLMRFASACASTGTGGSINYPCTSDNDCNVPFTCQPISPEGGCSKNKESTCQAVCGGCGDCQITGLNLVCSEPYSCLSSPNSQICIPPPPP
jgi:hypothetical protein